MILRPATEADAALLLAWRSDPETQRWSLSTEPITAEGHQRWLTATLSDPSRHLYIATLYSVFGAEEPLGVGRLDLREADAELSLTIAPRYRGQHLAVPVILALTEEARRLGSVRVLARVKGQNVASLRAFLSAGFWPLNEGVMMLERPLHAGVRG